DNITNLTLEAFAEERIAYGERLHDIFIKINEINPKLNIYLIGFFNPFYQFFPNITELEIIIDSWNIEGERMTEQYNNISFIPIKDIYDTVTVDYLADDNFHPNHYGYQLMAERILNYLTEKERSIYDNNE